MLLEHLQPDDDVIALIGVAKNAGKTTAMNRLIGELAEQNTTLGLLSVGIDGEAHDAVSGARKPSIWVPAGTWIATTDQMLKLSNIAVDIERTTRIRTPLGEVVVAQARRAGDVVLAGLRHRRDVRDLSGVLAELGARRVLIDGAFDRLAAAEPSTSRAVILATGLASGGGVPGCVKRTVGLMRSLALPRVVDGPPSFDAVYWEAPEGGWNPGPDTLRGWEGPELPSGGATPMTRLFIPGLVGDAMLNDAGTWLPVGGELVVKDPTRLLGTPTTLRRFLRSRTIAVARPVRVRAITVNPFDGNGDGTDTRDGRAVVDAVVAGLSALQQSRDSGAPTALPPVLDVKTGYCGNPPATLVGAP